MISSRASRIAASIGPAALSLAIGVFAMIGVQRLAAVRGSVTLSRDIAEALQTIVTRLTDAETAQRGYLLTDSREYLLPGAGAAADIHGALSESRRLVADPVELARLDSLATVVAEKLAELESTIRLYDGPGGRPAASSAVRSDRGRFLMRRARELTGAVAASERERLAARTEREHELTTVSAAAIFGAIVLAALLSLFSNTLLDRALRARETADERRDAAQAELERTNGELAEQAAEMEVQATEVEAANEELRATTEDLARQTFAAERASERVNDVLETMSDGFMAFDRDWTITRSNRAAVQITNTPAEALVGRSLWDVWGSAIPPLLAATLRHAMDAHTRDEMALEVAPGVWYDIRLNPTADGIAIFFRDVTADRQSRHEREILTAQVEAEHQRLATVVEQSPLAISIVEAPSGRMILANRQLEMIFGAVTLSNSLEAYSSDWRGFHADGRPVEAAEWPMARAIATGQAVIGEVIEIERRDGTRRRVSVNSAPVRDAQGRVSAGVSIFWDVTEQHEREQELRNARREAETASRAKSEFLAVMSHELRTPLAAIIGYEELLFDGITGPINEGQRTQLARIKASAVHLLSLIDEVLTLSRVEAGREVTHLERIPLLEALHEAAVLAEPLAAEKGLSMQVLPPACPAFVWADATKLRQILVNLLTNAIKFTDRGTVSLEGETRDDVVLIRVRDTGIGISLADQDRVFDTFWQVEQKSTRKVGGTGLGLSVSRRLARLMNGELTVTSAPGEGSTFTVRLPAARAS